MAVVKKNLTKKRVFMWKWEFYVLLLRIICTERWVIGTHLYIILNHLRASTNRLIFYPIYCVTFHNFSSVYPNALWLRHKAHTPSMHLYIQKLSSTHTHRHTNTHTHRPHIAQRWIERETLQHRLLVGAERGYRNILLLTDLGLMFRRRETRLTL